MINKKEISKLEKTLNSWIAGISDVARVEVEFNKNSASWLVGILYDLSLVEKDDQTVVINGEGLKMFVVALKNDLKEYLNSKPKSGAGRAEDSIEFAIKNKEAMIKINVYDTQNQNYDQQIYNFKLLS